MTLSEDLLLEMTQNHHSLSVLLFRVNIEQDLVFDGEKGQLQSNLLCSLLLIGELLLL